MKLVIFDMDNTLVNTQHCQSYLRSHAGREAVVEHVENGVLKTHLFDEKLVEYYNELSNRPDVLVLVVSDSPKDYCLAVLGVHGFAVDEDLVFGSQGKPCVDMEGIHESLTELYGSDFSSKPTLVVGDSPKDIYFARHIRAPAVFACWGTQFNRDFVKRNAGPEAIAENLDELKEFMERFLNGELKHVERDYRSLFLTADEGAVELEEFPEDNVGFGREYVPDWNEFRGKPDSWTWFDVNRSIKKAKLLTPEELEANVPVTFYSDAKGVIPGKPFKSNAGHFLRDFTDWLQQKGMSGKKIALVPMPSSLPRECNLSNTMLTLCNWWAQWINDNGQLSFNVSVWDCLERFDPTPPSHATPGVRTIEPHLKTMGLFPDDQEELEEGVDFIILIDDVWTSGTQMNAAATILGHHDFVPEGAKLYAYTLVKTTHPSPFGEVDLDELLKKLDSAQKKND